MSESFSNLLFRNHLSMYYKSMDDSKPVEPKTQASVRVMKNTDTPGNLWSSVS